MTFARGVAVGLVFAGPLVLVLYTGVTCGMQTFTDQWYAYTTLLVIQACTLAGGFIAGRKYGGTSDSR